MATATQITTGRVRFSYVNAFTARAAQEGAQPKYSVTLLIPKTDKNTIAKIKAQALNKVKLADAMSKLAGGCMVVENAGLIAPDKMTELMKLTAKDVNDVVVILTGATESINRLFGATGDAKDKFTHQINMEGISTQDMLAIAKGYFKQQGFKTDDSVEGTVKNLLMAMESGNIDRMLKACDEAMLKCDDREKAKGSSRKYLLSEDFK